MKKPWLVGAMCASVLFVYLPLAQADVVEQVERVMNKDVFGQSIFANSYVTLGANSTSSCDVSSGAATTLGEGAIVNGSILAEAATTLGADALVNGNVDSGAATSLGANSTIDGAVSSGAATTYGAGANVNWRTYNNLTLATYATPSPVTQDVIDAQAFLSGLEPDLVLIPGNIAADVTFSPGVYEVAGPLSVSAGTTITLDAEGKAGVFIFNISGYLSFGAGVNVVMINDTEDTRVIWNITGTYISVGADANIIGDLLAKTYVSTGANSTAGGAYSATWYVIVGAGSKINDQCGPSLTGGEDTSPAELDSPEGVVPTDPIDQPVFASAYATLGVNSTINGDVSSGTVTLSAATIVHGSILADAATTLGANLLVNGYVDSGTTTLSAAAIVHDSILAEATTTSGAGAEVNWRNLNNSTLATYAKQTPVIQNVIVPQAFLSGLEPDDVLLPSNIGAGVTFSPGVYQVAGSEINDPSLDVGVNTPPVAFDGNEEFVPTDPNEQPDSQSGSLFAKDADGDDLTFRVVFGSLGAPGKDALDFQLDPETGEWSIFCLGINDGADSFQWVANDGQADSNVATQDFVCMN
jgi:predicted acyltransferase (DUF342 family)